MADIDVAVQNDSEERQLIKSIARALWRADLAPNASVEERKTSWTEGQAEHRKAARKLIRALEAEGVTMSVSPTQNDDADADADQ